MGWVHQFVWLMFGMVGVVFSCTNSGYDQRGRSSKTTLPSSKGIYGTWDLLGYQKDQKVPDFTLHHQERARFNLYNELKQGKPLLLVNGSYTGDISRAYLPAINAIIEKK